MGRSRGITTASSCSRCTGGIAKFTKVKAPGRSITRARRSKTPRETTMNEPEKKDENASSEPQAAEKASDAKAPPAQEGDPKDEVAKPEAKPVLLPTVEQAKAELDV